MNFSNTIFSTYDDFEVEKMNSYEDVLEFVEDENVKFIRLAYFDVFGVQKNIAIMPDELRRAFTEGISIDASSVAGFGAEVHSDLFLRPDPTTLSIVPWRPIDGRVAKMFCDIEYPDGSTFQRDSRWLLKQAVRMAEDKGFIINIGTEVEFYIFKLDEKGEPTKIPQDNAGYMDIAPEDHGENIRREISFALVDMGIRPEASHHEMGPGQNEVDFRYAEPLEAADNASAFKWVVKSIANSDGVWADFSPKPLTNEPGNGMHINISVRSKDGKDYTDNFMAGILDHIREITLFLNPKRESYERLGDMKAPKYVSWSAENRSQLIRIPATRSDQKRIELRSPDPTANPYLAFMLLIYAGIDGIERKLEPMEPLDVNLFKADTSITDKLKRLPQSLDEAIAYARDSEFVRTLIPEGYLAAYSGEEV